MSSAPAACVSRDSLQNSSCKPRLGTFDVSGAHKPSLTDFEKSAALPSNDDRRNNPYFNGGLENVYKPLHDGRKTPLYVQRPTFRFRPCAFNPTTTKAKLVLKLCDDHELEPGQDALACWNLSCDLMADIFFRPGASAVSNRTRLMVEAQFVRFNGQLKSLRIPSLEIDAQAREIRLDWRQLCQDFLHDEYKCRLGLGSWSMRL